jgi:hypothetical protein
LTVFCAVNSFRNDSLSGPCGRWSQHSKGR